MQVKVYPVTTSLSLRDFLTSLNIPYQKGIGFYQLTKTELISNIKTLIVRRKSDGLLITGDIVRTVLGLPNNTVSFSLKDKDLADFDVFVQSTSPQRKLLVGTSMLCRVEDGGLPVHEVLADPNPVVDPHPVPVGAPTIITTPPTAPVEPVANTVLPVEVLITFDTTCSMYPCLTQVRQNVRQMIKELFNSIPGIRIGVMAHGDYADGNQKNPYVTKHIDLSVDVDQLCQFVEKVEKTNGFDWDECYELVLRKAHTEISWSKVAQKALIMIGDATPHPANSSRNAQSIDWQTEALQVMNSGIKMYSVQALGDRDARNNFWKPLATLTDGVYLELDQFAHIRSYITAICFHNHSTQQLQDYRTKVQNEGRMNRSLHTMFNTLLKTNEVFADADPKSTGSTMEAVPPSRFQVLDIGNNKISIKQFAEDNGLTFKVGRGFYQFTKSEVVSDKKEVVLVDKNTGDMFTGQQAIDLIGAGTRGKIKPTTLDKWNVFIQSTSVNRTLMPHTKFLYEVDHV